MKDTEKEPSLHGTSDYSPEVKKMLKGWKEPVFGEGKNLVLERGYREEDDGRRKITWKVLHDEYGYEKPAHGCKLVGDVSQRDKNNWQYQKHVKLRDTDGTEHAVFFYVDDPSTYDYEDMEVGSIMTIHSPRLHRFMDGQDGMRLDEEKMVGMLEKRPLLDEYRLDYAKLMRENGNRKFKEEKYEDAIEYYEVAVRHCEGSSFTEDERLKKESRDMEMRCHINIASSAVKLQNYTGAIEHCNRALAINPSSAKALFRLGQCHAARGNDKEAINCYNRALAHASSDPSVSAAAIKKELEKSAGETVAQKSAMKGMYSGFLGGSSKFGVRKGASALSGGVLSKMKNLYNFRDLTAGRSMGKKKMLKNLVYRASCVATTSQDDLNALMGEYGVKTILDLRSNYEKMQSTKSRCKGYDKALETVLIKPDKMGFLQMSGKGKELKRVLEGPVAMEANIVDEFYWRELGFWEKVGVAVLGGLCQGDRAEQIVVSLALKGKGAEEFYRGLLEAQGEDFAYLMDVIADPSNHPIVISDSQGKDTAALLSLLFLGTLSTPPDEIIDDFMTSQSAIPDDARRSQASSLALLGLDPTLSFVELDTVETLLDFLNGRYGGIPGYLDYYGFTHEKQKEMQKVFFK